MTVKQLDLVTQGLGLGHPVRIQMLVDVFLLGQEVFGLLGGEVALPEIRGLLRGRLDQVEQQVLAPVQIVQRRAAGDLDVHALQRPSRDDQLPGGQIRGGGGTEDQEGQGRPHQDTHKQGGIDRTHPGRQQGAPEPGPTRIIGLRTTPQHPVRDLIREAFPVHLLHGGGHLRIQGVRPVEDLLHVVHLPEAARTGLEVGLHGPAHLFGELPVEIGRQFFLITFTLCVHGCAPT
jgi:hypothetical protein